jgi:tetratricopeptide (TPR) repeat protein
MPRNLIAGLVWALLLAVRLPAQDAKQLYVQANVSYQQRQYAAAYQQYHDAAQLQPSMGPAWWGQANCLYLLGRKRDSLGAYLQAQRLMPTSSQVAARVRQVQAELDPPPLAPAFVQPRPSVAAPASASWWSPLWRSALLPGWGQAYNGQANKAWLLGGATWVSFAGVAGSYVLGSQADASYEAATTAGDAVNRYQTAYDYYVINQTFYVVFGLLYASNILDAALNANAPASAARAAMPGGVQLALLPDGFLLHKEWTW